MLSALGTRDLPVVALTSSTRSVQVSAVRRSRRILNRSGVYVIGFPLLCTIPDVRNVSGGSHGDVSGL